MRAADEDCCRYKRTKRLKKAIFRHDADSSARRLTNGEQSCFYRHDPQVVGCCCNFATNGGRKHALLGAQVCVARNM